MAVKVGIPKGTRDFSSEELSKRNYIFDIIKKSFINYGFQPIETPTFENNETLLGKYGEEGDRLIFKILNSGDFLNDIEVTKELDKINIINILLLKQFEFIKINSNREDFYNQFQVNLFNHNCLHLSNYIDKDCLFEKLLKLANDKEQDDRYINSYFYNIVLEFVSIYLGKISKKISPKITEKALRYDLTVPFARYVVQHQSELVFPFKRYQMQPVWRADRPQKGRFREFYQCDADVIGSNSLLQEIELVQLYDDVFTKLGLKNTIIKINNRKILSGIAEIIGAKDKLIDFTVAVDKLDKIGEEKVKEEMLSKGISANSIEKVQPLFNLNGTNQDKITQLSLMLLTSVEGMQGIEELKFIIETVHKFGLSSSQLQIDVTLARGLNYYTGSIFEVSAADVEMGSIGGGGRYDDLTGIFGLKNISGVGISFGLDRVYLVLDQLNLFPETLTVAPQVLILNDVAFLDKALLLLKNLRSHNISAELYPDATKIDKQYKYAERKGIKIVIKSISENHQIVFKDLSLKEEKQNDFDAFLNNF